MSTIRLYDHPATDALGNGVDGLPQLALVGDFPHAKPSLSYAGRISIVNPAGNCTVKKLSGDLPLGAAVTVDNVTHEVVVTWPAYEEVAAPILNAGFEAGDVGWQKGAGWTITTGDPPSGAMCAQYVDASGTSIIASAGRSACSPGTTINASCNVRQGASSAGNAGACVRLEFFDAAGNPLAPAEGNMVDSGSNGAVHPSAVTAAAPPNTASARIAARGFRKRENRKLYVDDFVWDLTQPTVGTNDVGSWCIVLEVTDELGRKAQWTGCIVVDSVFNKWIWVEELNSSGRTIRSADSYLGPWSTVALDAPGAPSAAGANGAWVSKLASLYIMYLFQGGQAIVSTDTDMTDATLTGVYKNVGSFMTFHERMVAGQHILYCTGKNVVPKVSTNLGVTWQNVYDPNHSTAWGGHSPPHLLSNGKWITLGEDNDFVGVGRRQWCICSDLVPGTGSTWTRINLSSAPSNYAGSDVSACNGTSYFACLNNATVGRRIYSYSSAGAQGYVQVSTSNTINTASACGGWSLGDGIIVMANGNSAGYISYNNGVSWVSRSFGATVAFLNRVGSLWVTGGDDATPRVSTDNGVTWANIAGIAANSTQLEQGVFPIPAQLNEAGTGLWDG